MSYCIDDTFSSKMRIWDQFREPANVCRSVLVARRDRPNMSNELTLNINLLPLLFRKICRILIPIFIANRIPRCHRELWIKIPHHPAEHSILISHHTPSHFMKQWLIYVICFFPPRKTYISVSSRNTSYDIPGTSKKLFKVALTKFKFHKITMALILSKRKSTPIKKLDFLTVSKVWILSDPHMKFQLLGHPNFCVFEKRNMIIYSLILNITLTQTKAGNGNMDKSVRKSE